ncbi:hypothetical protein EVG20_g4257 [Dentipellis fragilis]|uniref:Uncharacterized protein n=1 Tax=Dentipellis fragilis TaxID=205917 RepID=A0A4Y9YYY3_9AGAM|nr:hypothetical protein EVG20_g4257 [Dentipellis fragilis]
MSYHPYAAARDRRTSSSAYRTSTSAGYTESNVTTSSSHNATTSNVVRAPGNYARGLQVADSQISNTANSDDQVLPTGAQIDQEIYEAEVALNQGRISTVQYGKILCAGLKKGSARLHREYQGIQRALRGEDSHVSIQRDAGFTDAESDAWFEEIRRTINFELVNGRRGEARRLRRAITRGQ